MLLWLTEYLERFDSGFSVFQYLTLRFIMGLLTALLLAFLLGPFLIRLLERRRIGQEIRPEGPESHQKKLGTPTMGGLLILFCVTAGTLCWSQLDNQYVWLALLTCLGFGLLGGIDDYLKISRRDSGGLSVSSKFLWQCVLGGCFAVLLFQGAGSPQETQLLVPFIKEINPQLGWFFPILALLTVVGTSNGVNLSDGLDGLAVLPVVLVAGALAVFAYLSGHTYFSDYLGIPYITGAGELSVFCASIIGAGLAFLWYNSYPAQMFMGDIGALSLGAALGVVAVIVRQELTLVIMGGIFVLETLSVIIQVAVFKLTRRRVFRMAPLHHHFELKGWPEPKIIVRFWIITVILVLIGLASLKIR